MSSQDKVTTEMDSPGAYSEMVGKAAQTKADESQQLQEKKFADAVGESISPPFPPKQLAKLVELNTTHAKAGFSKARNVAGYGLEIKPHPEVDDPSEEQRETAEDFWFGEDTKWQVGPMESELATHADVLEMSWADYEFIGWLSLEVLTTTDGTPVGMAYVPAPTIRKRKDKPGFVQQRTGDLKYFGSFGDRYGDDRTFVNSDTGAAGGSVNNVANEIIFKRNHTPFVDHYGTPDIIPAVPNVTGDQAAREFNIDFFESNAVPRLAVIVEGGQLTEDSRSDIRKVMHGMKDEDHRSIILEVEKLLEQEHGFDEEQDVSIRVEPLTVGVEEDASFLEFHSHNEHEILKAHEVPPVEAGQIKSGSFSTDASEQRRGYLDTVINPKQEAFAQLLHETIHSALGVTDWIVSFKSRGVDNRLRDAEVALKRVQASQGAVTLNEVRNWLGMPSLDRPAGDMLLMEATGAPSMGGFEDIIGDIVDEQTSSREASVTDRMIEQGEAHGD